FHPMFQASATDLLKGAKATAYTFLGIEMLFILYPFIENKKKAKLPVYLGLSVSALLVLVTTIISIGYYSPYDLNKMNWSVFILFCFFITCVCNYDYCHRLLQSIRFI